MRKRRNMRGVFILLCFVSLGLTAKLVVLNKDIQTELYGNMSIEFMCQLDNDKERSCGVTVGLKEKETSISTINIASAAEVNGERMFVVNQIVGIAFQSLRNRLFTRISEKGVYALTLQNVTLPDPQTFYLRADVYGYNNNLLEALSDQVSLKVTARPKFITNLESNMTFEEGSTNTLTLKVYGYPKPNVNWDLYGSFATADEKATDTPLIHVYEFTIHHISADLCGRKLLYTLSDVTLQTIETRSSVVYVNVYPKAPELQSAFYNDTHYIILLSPINYGYCNSVYRVEFSDDENTNVHMVYTNSSLTIVKRNFAWNVTRTRAKSQLFDKISNYSNYKTIQKYMPPTSMTTTDLYVITLSTPSPNTPLAPIIGGVVCTFVLISLAIFAILYWINKRKTQIREQNADFSLYAKSPYLERPEIAIPNHYTEEQQRTQNHKENQSESESNKPRVEYMEIDGVVELKEVSPKDIIDELEHSAYYQIDVETKGS